MKYKWRQCSCPGHPRCWASSCPPAMVAGEATGAQETPANAAAVENIAQPLGAGTIPGVDLSDGFDVKDVIGLASKFLFEK